jgi:hypothetical protein
MRFLFIFVIRYVSVVLFAIPTQGTRTTIGTNLDPKTECLATDEDYTTFVCLTGESLRIPCDDADQRCPDWAKQGECTINPQYMLVHCRKSCTSCISLHGSSDIPQIAPNERTRPQVLQRLYETQEYLYYEAERNVDTLRKCFNKHSECTYWWANGECASNPAFMETECGPACQTCDRIVP